MENEIKMKQKHEPINPVLSKTIIMNRLTGELVDKIPEGAKPGEYREQQCFADCPSQADQSQRDENNINVLMKKYKPDELAAYLAAKNLQRPEIINHDFSEEPELMQAMNVAKKIEDQFNELPESIRVMFKGKPAEFLKYCENPKNRKQLETWGLAAKTKETIEALNAIQRDEADKKQKEKKQLLEDLKALDQPQK